MKKSISEISTSCGGSAEYIVVTHSPLRSKTFKSFVTQNQSQQETRDFYTIYRNNPFYQAKVLAMLEYPLYKIEELEFYSDEEEDSQGVDFYKYD